MRILHLSSLYPPDQVGGAEMMVASLAELQAAKGHEVAVACLSREEKVPSEQNGVLVHRTGHGMPFYIMDWPKKSPLDRIRYRIAMQTSNYTVSKMAAVVEKFKPDIVNSHSLSELNPRIWPMVKGLGVPLVHTLHDFKSLCTNASMFNHGKACTKRELKCLLIGLPHKSCQHSVDAIASVGTDILDRYISEGFFEHVPENLRRIIWNPIEPSQHVRDNHRAPQDRVAFGFLGRIEKSKGIEVLLEACRALPANGWSLLIAGRAIEGLDRYKTLAAGLPVEFIGFIDRDDFFDRIDCLVAPPIWSEPFGRTVAESYVRGVPAIGSRIAGIAEQIGEGQDDWLFAPNDPKELAQKMTGIIEQPGRLSQRTSNMSTIVSRVAPENITQQYLDLYQAVVDRGAATSSKSDV